MARLVCEELTKSYENNIAINDINLDTDFSGLGLVGPNGSGKTTLIKLLLGIIHPSEGSIQIDVKPEDIRVVSDQPKLPQNMTIDEWVFTLEDIFGSHLEGIDIQTDLGLDGHWQIKNLSAGQTRKAALLPAFYGVPELIIIDEPSNFLDITTRQYVLEILKDHVEQTGTDIIISSHNIDEIRLFSSDILLLKGGRLMEQIQLDKASPEFYEIQASNSAALEEELFLRGLVFFPEDTIHGRVIKVEPTPELWDAVETYTKGDGRVYSFNAIDSLQRMIEDLIE